MAELVQEDPIWEPNWQTSLKSHPLHEQVLLVSLVIVSVFAVVFFQVGFLIIGAIVLSGTIVGAVLKSIFARSSHGDEPTSLTKDRALTSSRARGGNHQLRTDADHCTVLRVPSWEEREAMDTSRATHAVYLLLFSADRSSSCPSLPGSFRLPL
jgi:hypothetical protein